MTQNAVGRSAIQKTLLAVAGTAALILTTGARAQSINYGALEQLFGEPVTTSATGTPQRVSEVPTNMTIVTADEIRQSGSRNIPEIISRVPGLDILRGGINAFDVGVRGYQQPFQARLLVLVDGRQVFVDDYSRTLWDNIPVNVDDIRQIEVVKGAASALFGSNAAGGVINIVTYHPIYDNNNVAAIAAGTQRTRTGDATATFNGRWGGTKFSVGGFGADEFNTSRFPLDSTPGHPGHVYAANRSYFQLSPSFQGNSEFTYSTSESSPLDSADYYLIGDQTAVTLSARVGFDWNVGGGVLSTNNFYNHSVVKIFEPTDGGLPYRLATDILVDQLQYQFKAGTDHTFRIGTEFRYKWFDSLTQQLEPQSPATHEFEYAVSGMWAWKIADTLTWTNAARFDLLTLSETGTLTNPAFFSASDYNNTIKVWSGNSDFVYKPTDKDSFRAGYGRGVQLPSFLQNSWGIIQHFGAITADFQANPKVRPTIVQDYSIDYDRHLPEILSHVRASIYYETNTDIITAMAIPVGNIVINGTNYQVITDENAGSSHGWGGEVQLKGSSPEGLRWDASYSLSRVVDRGDVPALLDYQGSAPKHHLRLLLGYTMGSWEFDAKGEYQTSTNMLRSPDGGQTFAPVFASPYASLSGRIGYNIGDNWRVAISGTNLTRKTTNVSPFPAIERQAFLTVTGKW